MKQLIDKIYFLWKNGRQLETKLASYQGYRHNSIIHWKNQTGLSWPLVIKILDHFEIYTAPKIRKVIRQIVDDHENIFSRENCFITGFGNAGKSGDIILYDFSHTVEIDQRKIKKTWELNSLPDGSTIVFVEDIIGTGMQSIDYILNKVNQIIKPSHEPFLLSLCATQAGVQNVIDNTQFQVMPGMILGEELQHYTEKSEVFSPKERQQIKSVNDRLKKKGVFDFDLGLMLAFYFTIPNNSMPIFWKDNYSYVDAEGKAKEWTALLPRRF